MISPRTLLSSVLALFALSSVVRAATCTLSASGSDDAPALVSALGSCSTVTVPAGTTLSIRSPMNTTTLKNVHLSLAGTIKYYDNVTYWASHAYYFEFQDSYTFWLLGGSNILVDGGGTIDGSGQTWWTAFASNSSLIRPIPLTLYQANGAIVENISMIQSPMWFNLVHTSKNVTYNNVNLSSVGSGLTPSNTDGWDTYRSDTVTIQNSVIVNNDDCVSFKPNSTNMIVQNLSCSGSHGVSVGSLGQYAQYVDIVENVTVKNVSLTNAQNGARIKVWAGEGVGSGRVNNVLYDTIKVTNVDTPLTFDQCYETSDSDCTAYPSRVNITNVVINILTGTSSGKEKAVVANLQCSPGAVCSNITVNGLSVTPPSKYGAATTVCEDLTVCGTSASLFNCTGNGSGKSCS